MLRSLVAALATLFLFCGISAAQEPPSFEAFAQDPSIRSVGVSPNGRWLSVVRRASVDGDPFVEIYDSRDLGKGSLRTLGARGTRVNGASWLNDDQLLVSFVQQMNEGERTFQIPKVATINRERGGFNIIPKVRYDRKRLGSEADTLESRASASIISRLPEDPDHIVVSYTADFTRAGGRFVPVSYVGKLNVSTGKVIPTFRGNTKYGGYRVDQDGDVRLAVTSDTNTGQIVYVARVKGSEEWVEIGRSGAGSASTSSVFGVYGFYNHQDLNEIIVVSNHESDTTGLYTYDIASRSYKELLFRHPRYDAGGVATVRDPDNQRVRYLTGFGFQGGDFTIVWIDDFEKQFHEDVGELFPGRNVSVVSQSRDLRTRVIAVSGDRYPLSYHLYTPENGVQPIGETMPLLKPEQLAERKFVRYEARDGYEIPAYVTIPKGERPFPTVVMPHGGPTARDGGGFDLWAQMLASRGYAVIQPQFRVSTGFGRAHLEAGFAEWGKLQQDDIDDAGSFLVELGIADPDNLAIFGWSYGGYSSAIGAARDPNPYQCAIPGAAVTDLPKFRAWLYRGGQNDPIRRYRDTVEGLDPVSMAESVDIPVLIIHGTEDERVPISHSDIYYNALRRAGKDVEYIKLEGANHFFGTIDYEHWMVMFPNLIRFLDEDCGMKD